jgi:formylglycine-generating enzyme required for sulfatase activity
VGSYTGSASPSGTFDQGGNVWEWNEQVVPSSYRGQRGGYFQNDPWVLAASGRYYGDPASEHYGVGLRVATVPEPATGLLVMAGLLGLAGWRRRERTI